MKRKSLYICHLLLMLALISRLQRLQYRRRSYPNLYRKDMEDESDYHRRKRK